MESEEVVEDKEKEFKEISRGTNTGKRSRRNMRAHDAQPLLKKLKSHVYIAFVRYVFSCDTIWLLNRR